MAPALFVEPSKFQPRAVAVKGKAEEEARMVTGQRVDRQQARCPEMGEKPALPDVGFNQAVVVVVERELTAEEELAVRCMSAMNSTKIKCTGVAGHVIMNANTAAT